MAAIKFSLILLLLVDFTLAKELLNYDPIPNPNSVIVTRSMRFTVLTSQVIRIETMNVAVFYFFLIFYFYGSINK